MDKFPCFSQGFVYHIHFLVKANLFNLIKRHLQFRIIEDIVVCHAPFPIWKGRWKITDPSYAMIGYVIPLVRASTLFVAEAHGLGKCPDTLSHCSIYPLYCQATLLLPNRHSICCPLVDSNTWILGLDVDILSHHLDCSSIRNDWFRQSECISLHLMFRAVVNDWVVDIKYLLLWTSTRSVEYSMTDDTMRLLRWGGCVEFSGQCTSIRHAMQIYMLAWRGCPDPVT